MGLSRARLSSRALFPDPLVPIITIQGRVYLYRVPPIKLCISCEAERKDLLKESVAKNPKRDKYNLTGTRKGNIFSREGKDHSSVLSAKVPRKIAIPITAKMMASTRASTKLQGK